MIFNYLLKHFKAKKTLTAIMVDLSNLILKNYTLSVDLLYFLML